MTKVSHAAMAWLAPFACALAAHAQWVTFSDETASRLVADPSVGIADGMERDYAIGDFDRDGWMDLVVARKVPYSLPGGRRGVLLMNERGVLTDRTLEKASAADLPGSLGMLDPTNTRDIEVADLNGDGWLDLVTAPTISDGLPKHLGHPRVYLNLGEVGGVWQGFRFEDARIPQLVTMSGLSNQNPRFCDVAVGDVTGDGRPDLYFSDYDTGEVGPPELPANEFNNRLLINTGGGFFIDESLARMGPTYTSQWLLSNFGMIGTIADFNGDGRSDVMRVTTLSGNIHLGLAYNNAPGTGVFTTQPYQSVVSGSSPYGFSAGDLNNDGRLDIVLINAPRDRVGINMGTTPTGTTTWSFTNLSIVTNAFGGEIIVADLDNDDWNDFLITDVDEDTYSCSRISQVYHNMNGASFVYDAGNLLAAARQGLHDAAALDINGDCWLDLVFAKCASDSPGAESGTTMIWINNAPGGSACPQAPCPADLNGDHVVSGLDLASLLAAWGPCPGTCAADLNHDGVVSGLDLAGLLAAWGSCPRG